MKRAIITVSGKVQGVFFRKFVMNKANELGLVGEVKNLPHGTVQITAEGKEDTLRQLVESCKKGSPASKVKNVTVEYQAPKQEFSSFSIVM